MARQAEKSPGSSRRQSKNGFRSRNGSSASQKPEKYRFAYNVDGKETAAESEYRS